MTDQYGAPTEGEWVEQLWDEQEPDIDDGPYFCPECERPNQFGELCNSCLDDIEQGYRAGSIF